ncbi:MAG: hypothetical protein LBP22_17465, partial [Deltaproteobacteria bacterium]|nr:hypothetical protein [Deltaproteobacteria bacterium]
SHHPLDHGFGVQEHGFQRKGASVHDFGSFFLSGSDSKTAVIKAARSLASAISSFTSRRSRKL